MPAIYFHYADRQLTIKDKTGIKNHVAQLFAQEKQLLNRLDYIFCSDKYLLDINRRFLNHDYYTDIISFDLSETGGPVSGEIYISLDRVKDNGVQLGNTFQSELLRVVFHGALHLCGYKDKTTAEKEKMRRKEGFYMEQYVSRDTVSL